MLDIVLKASTRIAVSGEHLLEVLLDNRQLGLALGASVGQLSLCSPQLLLHALVLGQVHLAILLLQLLCALLPLLSAVCGLHGY